MRTCSWPASSSAERTFSTSAGRPQPVVVAGGEEQDLLAVGGRDDVRDVAHDQRAPREAAEVDGLQVGELRVVALDGEDDLARADLVALVQRADLQLVPAALPDAVLVSVAGAPAEDRDRLVDAAEDRVVLLLDDLHDHAR